MDHNILLKDPYEFFGPDILTDRNDQLFQQNEDNMFDCDILDNYANQILMQNVKK